jgi:hypothetical protein
MRGGIMARLTWNAVGERTFEAGVDRGVLYVEGSDGVPWNGLVSVSESPDGGSVTPYYIDGIKYLNHVVLEEFKATIEAFTYPREFEACDGTKPIGSGLFATQQTKTPFGLSYRVGVGNDIKGIDYAYRIHLVYNATAAPSERANNTIGMEVEPANFSWEVVTKPPVVAGYKPTSHFVLDSRDVPPPLLRSVEDILYGSYTTSPRLPSVTELLFLFSGYETSGYDAGTLVEEYFSTVDAGVIPAAQTETIDPGGP